MLNGKVSKRLGFKCVYFNKSWELEMNSSNKITCQCPLIVIPWSWPIRLSCGDWLIITLVSLSFLPVKINIIIVISLQWSAVQCFPSNRHFLTLCGYSRKKSCKFVDFSSIFATVSFTWGWTFSTMVQLWYKAFHLMISKPLWQALGSLIKDLSAMWCTSISRRN